MKSDWRAWALLSICLVWVVNFIAPVFKTGYMPPKEVNLVFGPVIAALLWSFKASQKKKPDKDKEDEELER